MKRVEEHPVGSGRYRVRARVDGKRITVASGLTEAQAEETALGYVKSSNVQALRHGVTLEAFGHGFMERRERAGVRGVRNDRSRWSKHVAKDPIGALTVSSIDRRDVKEWLDRRQGAYRTRVRVLSLLTVALEEAVDRELLTANPAKGVKVHKSGAASSSDGLEGILSFAEQKALLDAVPASHKPVVAFALFTGVRQAELWWLKWEDVLADRIVIRRSTGGLPPKGGRPREVFLLPMARAALDAQPRTSEYAFPAPRSNTRRAEGAAPHSWAKWLAAAGITRHVRWHDLRHTCATSLLAGWWGRKWTLDEVCRLLGHSSVTVTERYARKLNETQMLAARETPMLGFGVVPMGTEVIESALFLPENTNKAGAFVKHRSRVQISQSAPEVTAHSWDQAGTRKNLGAEAKARTAGSAVSTPLPEVAGANPARPTKRRLGETHGDPNRPGPCAPKGSRGRADVNSPAAWSLALAAESLRVSRGNP